MNGNDRDTSLLQWKTRDFLFPLVIAIAAGISFYKNYFISLDAVRDGIISIATYEGVDINARIRRFYGSGAAAATAFLLALWLYRFFIRRLRFSMRERIILSGISLSAIAVSGFSALIYPEWHSLGKIFTGFTVAAFLLVTSFRLAGRILNVSWDRTWVAGSGAFVALAFFTYLATLFNQPLSSERNELIVISGFAILFCLTGILGEPLFKRVFRAVVPLAALPLLYFLTNELFLAGVRRGVQWSPRGLFLILCAVLLFWTVSRYWRSRRQIRIQRTRAVYCFLLVGSFMVTLLYQVRDTDWFVEDFELANQANALMSIFRFGQLPVVEFGSSHLFSDFLHGVFYFLLHGYDGSGDFLIYVFLPSLIGIIAAYLLLNVLFRKPWFSLFFVALVPILYEVQFPSRFSATILCFLLLHYFLKHPRRSSFFWLIAGCAFTLLWRVDNAVVTLPAVVTALILWAREKKQFQTLSRFSRQSCLLFGIPALVLFLVLAVRYPLFDNINDLLGYIGASQAHGFPDIIRGNPMPVNTVNFVLPLAVIFLSLYCLHRYSKGRMRLSDALIVLFFAIVYLLNFQRGIVRHAPGDKGNDVFLSSTVYFLLPFAFLALARIRRHRHWLFLSVSWLFVMAFKTSHPQEGNILLADALGKLDGHSFATKEDAVSGRMKSYREHVRKYDSLKVFMERNFPASSSFIDLSNTPMLYYYLQRPVPGYFCQYAQNMVTAPIQERNLRKLQSLDLPVAIFSSFPRDDFFDRTDGVENTLRYHKLSAYLFSHYQPLGAISGKMIWLKKGTALRYNNADTMPVHSAREPQQFNIGKTAYLWAKGRRISGPAFPLVRDPDGRWRFPQEIDRTKGNYIILTIDNSSGEPQWMQTNLLTGAQVTGSFGFWISPDSSATYLVPLSTQYNWYALPPAHLKAEGGNGLSIRTISLYNDL